MHCHTGHIITHNVTDDAHIQQEIHNIHNKCLMDVIKRTLFIAYRYSTVFVIMMLYPAE